MNIFELYLDKIKSTILHLSKKNQLVVPETFNGINAEIPPPKFDCDKRKFGWVFLKKKKRKGGGGGGGVCF